MYKNNIRSYLLTSSLSFFILGVGSFSYAMQNEEEDKCKTNSRVNATLGGHTEGKDQAMTVSGNNNKVKSFHINMGQTQTELKEEKNGVHIFFPDVIKIVSAKYGANGWIRNGFNDVEPWVEPKFNNKPVNDFSVSNKNLGGIDPAKGHTKTLNVFYKCMRGDIESNIMNAKAKEGDILRLSCINNKEKEF